MNLPATVPPCQRQDSGLYVGLEAHKAWMTGCGDTNPGSDPMHELEALLIVGHFGHVQGEIDGAFSFFSSLLCASERRPVAKAAVPAAAAANFMKCLRFTPFTFSDIIYLPS
jgi:hypothetical protein